MVVTLAAGTFIRETVGQLVGNDRSRNIDTSSPVEIGLTSRDVGSEIKINGPMHSVEVRCFRHKIDVPARLRARPIDY
jgi:hypothetical protein